MKTASRLCARLKIDTCSAEPRGPTAKSASGKLSRTQPEHVIRFRLCKPERVFRRSRVNEETQCMHTRPDLHALYHMHVIIQVFICLVHESQYRREGHLNTTFYINSSVLYQYLCLNMIYDLRVSSGLLLDELKAKNSTLREKHVPV